MATTTVTQSERVLEAKLEVGRYPEPLSVSGALDKNKFEELTPVIGREYPTVNLVDDIINAKNSAELIRDLAITSKLYVLRQGPISS